VNVGVNPARQDVVPDGVHHVRIGVGEVFADLGDLFVFNQDVSFIGFAGCDQGAVFYQGSHFDAPKYADMDKISLLMILAENG